MCNERSTGRNKEFGTTRWSVVLLSAQSRAPGSDAALAELCKIYWYPVYAFVRRRGYDPNDAEDLTQGFFLHLLDNKAVRRVSPRKGKFRSFLAVSLRNYISDEAERMRSIKRGGQVEFVALNSEFAEARYRLERTPSLTSEQIFDARWATTLLEQVLISLRAEYEAQGKACIFEVLKPFLTPGNSQPSPLYDQVANSLQVSVGSVKTLIFRLRKRYAFLLREQVGRTVGDPADVDEELHALCEALLATKGASEA